MADADYERGLDTFEKVIGFRMPEGGPDFLQVTIRHLFAGVWSRPGLPVRDRRLLTLGVLAMQGKPDSIEEHIRAAMRNGEFTRKELEEAAIHLAHYCGWSLGAQVFNVVMKVAAELKAEKKAAEGAKG